MAVNLKEVNRLRRTVPRVLWKYCATSALPMLINLQIKVTRPNEFNDPFEFTPAFYGTLTTADLERFYTDPEWVAHWQLPPLPPGEDDRRRMLEEGATMLSNTGFEIAQEELDRISSKYGILCLSADPENILMWSHYAQNHRGFAVGIDGGWLRAAKFFPVEYSTRRVTFSAMTPLKMRPDVRSFDIFRRKSVVWAYEKEYRTIWALSELIPGMIGTTEAYFLPLIPDAIAEVRLGYRCSSELEEEIRKVLTAHSCVAPVRRANLQRHAYRLNFG
ncbi:MAG TPA: DUF2971 domain-containing protein [Gemmata sp.]|jgi:hypothetical protein|nr:DUF2971 domain-containing protein [Gemmata sp.]